MTDGERLDFVAVGDILTDAFIKIKDAAVHCRLDNTNCELCFRYGDKVPFEDVTVIRGVGNAPNGAVSAARLGLSVALVANIGEDDEGEKCKLQIEKEGINTSFISSHAGFKTNYHYVLWYEVDRTILTKHANFPRQLPDISPAPKWLYLSSLGDGTEEYHAQIMDYLEKNTETNLAFQPGTYQMKQGVEKLSRIYKRTNLFVCNKEEAGRITGLPIDDVKSLFATIHSYGPKLICITDGPNGVYASDGNKVVFLPPYPDVNPAYERTGAGDAFASTVASALAMDVPFFEALLWGPINSMSVVQKIGAQEGLLSKDQLLEYLKNAPAEYQIKEI